MSEARLLGFWFRDRDGTARDCVETQTPRLLVLLELPTDETRWVTVTGEELILRRRAYWLSLQGLQGLQGEADDPVGRQTVTVRIPADNVLDVDALTTLMEQSRRGDI